MVFHAVQFGNAGILFFNVVFVLKVFLRKAPDDCGKTGIFCGRIFFKQGKGFGNLRILCVHRIYLHLRL